jgi:hypothetical protein
LAQLTNPTAFSNSNLLSLNNGLNLGANPAGLTGLGNLNVGGLGLPFNMNQLGLTGVNNLPGGIP